jgi:polysaccharide biosynthesis protein PslJ
VTVSRPRAPLGRSGDRWVAADRFDAVTVLSLYLVLLIGIPAQLVFAPLGAAGTPAQMLAMGVLVWWVARRLAQLPRRRALQPVRRALLVFALVLIGSYFVAATRPIDAIELRAADRGLLSLCAWAGIVLATTDGVTDRLRLDVLLRRLVTAVGVLAGLGVVQFFTGLDVTRYLQIPGLVANTSYAEVLARADFRRPAGTATHPIEFGVVLAIVLPLALHFALHGNGKPWRRWLPVALIATALPISISRSAIVGAVVVLLFLLPTWPVDQRRRAYVALVGLIGAVYLVVPGLLGTLRNLFTGLLGGGDSSTQSRTNSYGVAAHYISERPVLGRGVGTFLPSYQILDNQYLITMIEAGLLGSLALFGLFFTGVLTARGIRRRSTDPVVRSLAQSLAAAIAVALVAFGTFDALSFPMAAGTTFFVLGCIGAMWRLHVILPDRVDVGTRPAPARTAGQVRTAIMLFGSPASRSKRKDASGKW